MDSLQRVAFISSQVDAGFHETAKALGISDSKLALLYALRMFGNSLPMKDLIGWSALPKQTADSALGKMREEGLVVQESMGGRAQKVTLTQRGIEEARVTADRLIEAEDEMISSWSAARKAHYMAACEDYVHMLRDLVAKIRKEGAADDD